MEKKKVYVFFTFAYSIGGTEVYTAGKINYLQKLGWEIFIFCGHSNGHKSIVPGLAQIFKNGNGFGMNFLINNLELPYMVEEAKRTQYLDLMISKLNLSNLEEYDIIIESHIPNTYYWAELLAAKIKARHFPIVLGQFYARPIYKNHLDFFYFKLKRNELVGSKNGLSRLFGKYKNVTDFLIDRPPTVAEQNPIQDIAYPIEKIKKLDWNICHLGRPIKRYVPYVIKGVGELARKYPDKKINFIMIGSLDRIKELLDQTFKELPNVILTPLGSKFPIPRILLSKVDVACAISQSARFLANEDILTICGSDQKIARTPGVLGYDTKEQVYGPGTFSYLEALENVLVKRIYDTKEYTLPKLRPEEEYYENFWTIVKNAAPEKEYYVEGLLQPPKV